MANELISGVGVVLYATKEGTFGAHRPLAGGYAMRTLSESFTPAEEREPRPDRSGSADHLARIKGRKSATWEVSKLILPNGTAGTPPDDHEIWENALGNAVIDASGVTYSLATAHNTTLTLRRGVRANGDGSSEFQEHVRGAVASRTEISWGNQGQNGLASVSFGGDAKDWGFTGNTTLNNTDVAGILVSTLTSTFDNVKQLTPGSLFKMKLDTGGGSGIIVDSINVTNKTIVWSEGLEATHANTALTPYNPTESTNGEPIHGRIGLLSLNGSSTVIKHVGGRVTLEDNRSLLNEEVGSDSGSRVLRDDRRNVTFSMEFLIKKEEVPDLLGSAFAQSGVNVQVNVGDAPGKTLQLLMTNGDLDLQPIDMPDQANARYTMQGQALGTSGNDSITVRFR